MQNPKCNSCSQVELKRVDGLFALTKVEKDKNAGSVNFMPASGIPVVVFICPSCGEMKLFPAKLLGEI